MIMLPNVLTLRLFKRAQSARLSLPQRLRALGQMAQGIDQSLLFFSESLLKAQPQVSSLLIKDTVDITTLLTEATELVHSQLLPRIKRYHVQIMAVEQLNELQHTWLRHYFQQQIYPLLTPLAVDPGRPFPYLQSKRLHFLVVLQAANNQGRAIERYGVVQIPMRLPRLIEAGVNTPLYAGSRAKPMRCLLWREEIVRYFLPILFSGLTISAAYQFRLLRADEETINPTTTAAITDAKQRQGPPQAPITLLDIEKKMPTQLRQWLVNHLRVTQDRVLDYPAPLALADLCELADHLAPPRVAE
jgi:polyphosphate kinase